MQWIREGGFIVISWQVDDVGGYLRITQMTGSVTEYLIDMRDIPICIKILSLKC